MGKYTAAVYIITNIRHTTLYIGFTTNLFRRIVQHREKYYPKSFSAKYNLNKLVYYEFFNDPAPAIERENQLKAGSRGAKLKLIEEFNPLWEDLFEKDLMNFEDDELSC